MLLLDEGRRLLILKPTYKDGWEIPGGLAEAGESPWQAAHREVLEEVDLDRWAGALLSVEWRPPIEHVGDGVHFIFDGGLVTAAEAASMRLQASEIAEARFLPPDEACALLPDRLAARVRLALAVQPLRPPVYLEAGQVRGGPGYRGAGLG
ncbi:MAG: NUDIX hydrolase [Dehalococcoidia bacterium]|nr:NUDIX hydrolase [Dehalococcoidia bacterium]